jgi:hypothetical protein
MRLKTKFRDSSGQLHQVGADVSHLSDQDQEFLTSNDLVHKGAASKSAAASQAGEGEEGSSGPAEAPKAPSKKAAGKKSGKGAGK